MGSKVKCSSFGKFRFRDPSNISTGRYPCVRVRMYAVNHGITLHVVSDELSSRGQDRCRHHDGRVTAPKSYQIVVVCRWGSWYPKETALRPLTYIPEIAGRGAYAQSSSPRSNSSNIYLSANLNQTFRYVCTWVREEDNEYSEIWWNRTIR